LSPAKEPGLKESDKQMKRKRVGIVIFPDVEVLARADLSQPS
jgi:hypothetical protein